MSQGDERCQSMQLNALSRGNATSHAPIWTATRVLKKAALNCIRVMKITVGCRDS